MTNMVKRVGVASILAILVAAAAGCWQPPGDAAPPEAAAGPLLDAAHEGWEMRDCAACHALPVDGHEVFEVWECADCHGGNGACIAGGFGEHTDREHDARAACPVCHEQMHGFEDRAACAACHFASAGTVACGGE
jgi:hypothetical protein